MLDLGLSLLGLSVLLVVLSRNIFIFLSVVLVLSIILILTLFGPAFRNIGRILVVLGIGDRWRRILVYTWEWIADDLDLGRLEQRLLNCGIRVRYFKSCQCRWVHRELHIIVEIELAPGKESCDGWIILGCRIRFHRGLFII